MLRLFVGVSIPSEWQEELSSVVCHIKETVKDARWVPTKNMHITLKFLGACDEEVPETILAALSAGLSTVQSFSFRLGEFGAFPSPGRTRIFWMGVDEGRDEMVDLAARTEKSLAPLGFEPECKRFHPHVTLARLKRPQDLRGIIADQSLPQIKDSLIEVKNVILFKSTLAPKGAIYSKMGEVNLKRTMR